MGWWSSEGLSEGCSGAARDCPVQPQTWKNLPLMLVLANGLVLQFDGRKVNKGL